jgi:hypothetical protein
VTDMSDDLWKDEQLLAMLAEALHSDVEVPRTVIEAGYAAYTWRNIDIELAALTYDSIISDVLPAAARSERAPLRALTFACSSLTIELELVPDALIGQLVGEPPDGEIFVEFREAEPQTLQLDETGCFSIQPIPTGSFRLQLSFHDRTVATSWIAL